MVPRLALFSVHSLLRFAFVATICVAASLPPAARAAPAAPSAGAALDLSFGGFGDGGRLLAPWFGSLDIRDAVQLPDGSMIAVGSTGADFVIGKYTPSGAPDSSFGSLAGWQIVNLSANADYANAVAVAADGKILVAGVADSGTAANFGLVRLNPNGSLDTSFNGSGIKTIDFNGRRDSAHAVYFFEDDIFVAGSAEEAGTFCGSLCPSNIGVARLDGVDGALVGTFGSGGTLQTDLVGSEHGLAMVLGNCGFYVAGTRLPGINDPGRFIIARYHAGLGTPVAAFGGGVVSGTNLSGIVNLACLPDGSLLAMGDGPGEGGDPGDVGLLNLTSTGAWISDFGTGGLKWLDFGGLDGAGALTVLPDETVMVAAHSDQQIATARLTDNGQVITGTLALMDMTDVGGTAVQALAVALTADLRVRTLAHVATAAGPRLALAQRFLDGTLDAGGRVALDYKRQGDVAAAVAFQPDGGLLVAGATLPGSGPEAGLVARYTVTGALDVQFGLGGLTTTAPLTTGAKGLLVQPDGKIIVLGSGFNLVRLTAAGLADSGFGDQGYAQAGWPGAQSGTVVRQGDGRLVLAGSRSNGIGNITFAVARFTPDGQLDDGFGAGGTVATGVGFFSAATDAVLQPGGKIVAVGLTTSNVDETLQYDFALVRYLANGNVDSTFGTNGRVTTDFGSGEVAMTVVALPDGKLLAAGYSLGQGMALARYLPNGALDPDFGAGGRLLLQFTGAEVITDLALDGAGVVAAVCDFGTGRGLVARLTAAGEFAGSFNGNGRAPFDFPGGGCPAVVAVAPGRIAAAGSAQLGFGPLSHLLTSDFAVEVYLSGRTEIYLPLVLRGP